MTQQIILTKEEVTKIEILDTEGNSLGVIRGSVFPDGNWNLDISTGASPLAKPSSVVIFARSWHYGEHILFFKAPSMISVASK